MHVHSLVIRRQTADGAIGLAGLPQHPPIVGDDGRFYGHEWSRWRYDSMDERVDELLQARGGTKAAILDIGCATGARAAAFAEVGFKVTGLDVVDRSEEIERRNRAFGRDVVPIAFHCLDVSRAKAADLPGQFDVVHARRVINFLRPGELDGFFHLVRAVMTAEALLVLSFTAFGISDGGEMSAPSPPGGITGRELFPGLHAHHFGTVRDNLQKHGFTIAEAFSDTIIDAGLIATVTGPEP